MQCDRRQGYRRLRRALSSLEKLETLTNVVQRDWRPGRESLCRSDLITDGALAESLKKLDLGNLVVVVVVVATRPHWRQGCAHILASAISGGAIYQCKSVNLKGIAWCLPDEPLQGGSFPRLRRRRRAQGAAQVNKQEMRVKDGRFEVE